MATKYDHLLPIATKLINGLSQKPGIKIVDKTIAANFLAQALNGMIERKELPIDPPVSGTVSS